MIPLNPAQIQILQERLRVMRYDLLVLLERQRERRGGTACGRVNTGDAHKLGQIEAALQRVELGQFGACADCDRRIGIRRLVDDPCAVLCGSCAREREQAATAARTPASEMRVR